MNPVGDVTDPNVFQFAKMLKRLHREHPDIAADLELVITRYIEAQLDEAESGRDFGSPTEQLEGSLAILRTIRETIDERLRPVVDTFIKATLAVAAEDGTDGAGASGA